MMRKFHETLSDRSVYMRYFSSPSFSSRVAHERLSRMCFLDYDRTMALVAISKNQAEGGGSEILGVGRLIKSHSANEAELAILVSDRLQRQGLGGELLSRTLQFARDEKIGRVSAEMLRDNITVQNIFRKAGFRLQTLANSSSICADLSL